MKKSKYVTLLLVMLLITGCSKKEEVPTNSLTTTKEALPTTTQEELPIVTTQTEVITTVQETQSLLFDSSEYPVITHFKDKKRLLIELGYEDETEPSTEVTEEPTKRIIRYYTYKNADGEEETETWGIIHDDYWNYIGEIPETTSDENDVESISQQLLEWVTENYPPPQPLNYAELGIKHDNGDGTYFYENCFIARYEYPSGNSSLKCHLDIVVQDNVIIDIPTVHIVDWRR